MHSRPIPDSLRFVVLVALLLATNTLVVLGQQPYSVAAGYSKHG